MNLRFRSQCFVRRYCLTFSFLAALAAAGRGVAGTNSVARIWDEQILSAIRIDTPNPPVHARNLYSVSICMYDAWAAYDSRAVGYLYRGKGTAVDVEAARREAISFAAYRMLTERYALSRAATNTLPALADQMVALGYDTNNVSRDVSTPAGLGNAIYDVVSAWLINDGANQTNGYKDFPASQGGYSAVNPYLDTSTTGVTLKDVNHWQPLQVPNALDQNGEPTSSKQAFVGAQWIGVRPFSMVRHDPTTAWIDPGPPPHLGGDTTDDFRNNVVETIRRSSQLTPDDGVTVDISPNSFGNNSLGANDGAGYTVNPVTGLAYLPNVVKRGDYGRVLAEFWADGPRSETPPGHWNVLANQVSDHPATVKRVGGSGPVVSDLEWDVKLYFALNAAVHEAACAAWSLKRQYDGWRPLSVIRYMGGQGQSSDPTLPSYSTNGLPLIPGLIELVTPETAATGMRHYNLPIGKVVIRAWGGTPDDPTNQYSGVRWMTPSHWVPYQKPTFVTPAFPGYISGHSTFSRSAAEVLTAFTGSPYFPGGLATYTVEAKRSLSFEQGPSQTVQLQWASYYDAADQAGVSRLFGGIHVPIDDFVGRRVGSHCGKLVWDLARLYFDGSVTNAAIHLTMQGSDASSSIQFNTLRGLYYRVQSAADLAHPFVDVPNGLYQATEGFTVHTNLVEGAYRLYRVVSGLKP